MTDSVVRHLPRIGLVGILCVATEYALGGVADMRALVARRPELIHHWTFEGNQARSCLIDTQSQRRLRGVAQPQGKPAELDLRQYGSDKTSRGLTIARKGKDRGIVAQTTEAVRFEREGTVELLFCARSIPPGEFNKGWMAFTSTVGGSRLYLAGVSHFRDRHEVIAGFGSGSPFHEKAEVVIARQDGTPSFELGRWYYLAVTYSHSRRTGGFVINAWIAPVGVAGATLVHTVQDAKRTGSREPVGVRTVWLGCAAQASQIFDGAIDEVALYDRPLSGEILESHYAALRKPASVDRQVDLALFKQPPLYRVSKSLAGRHAKAYTKEWQCTSPDLVVYLPDAQRGPRADNQHFIVFPLKNGDFFALWTAAYHESHPNQHIVFSKSADRGVTWSPPVTVAGPKVVEKDGKRTYEGLASWGFPIYVPDKNRVYVFYNKGIGLYDPQPGLSGAMRFVYTDDDGRTWSREYDVPMRRTAIMSPDPNYPPNWIIWQQPVELTPGQIIGCGTIWASTLMAKQDPKALTGSECFFWRFDNILTEDEPSKIRVTLLPDGGHGIRMPNTEGSRASTAEEPTVVRLSDGRWFCVFRTYRGCVGCAVSTDQGQTWSEARPLVYRDGGPRVLQPTASCPLYALRDGRFLLTFHNNDGTANGGRHPWDWRYNRSPAFYSVGTEMLDKDQPVWFTPPVMFLDNEVKPWGPTGRRSVAVYTSFFEFEAKRWYWYPDRKHFLLGKFITDEMLAEAGKVRP